MTDITNKTQNLVDDGKFNSGFGAGPRRNNQQGISGTNTGPGANQFSGVRQSPQTATSATGNNNSPAKAPAAPTGGTQYLFTGLAEAMNTYQNELVATGVYNIADIYEFDFLPVAMGAATLKKPGSTDRSKTANKQATSAKQAVDPNTDRVDKNSQNFNVQAGTQIVQIIDQIMRNSSYVFEQATTQIDPLTQQSEPSPGTGTGITTWYKISVQATALGYDDRRRDYAYRIKYLVTPYAITQMASEFFPDSRYRGSHKRYNYWFTGQNTQIINFEQVFNNLYRLTLSGQVESGQTARNNLQVVDYREVYSKTAMPTTDQKTGQTTGTYTNAAADSAADYLYSPSDLATVKVKIIGDPAWLQQGEMTTGINSQQFSFTPFNLDGGINFDSQEVLFDIAWNQPQDYNTDTGVMNVNNQNGRSKQNNTYQAIECRSTFSKGKFEQELLGKLFIEFRKSATPSTERPPPVSTISTVRKPAFEEGFTLTAGLSDTRNAVLRDTRNILGNRTAVKTFVGRLPGQNQ